jgi:hypothetical protein
MKIFLCYASEDHATAERVFLSLRGAGHEVFFDRESLPAGDTYELQILEAIDECDLMIVLVSPEAMTPGAYPLTEIGIARRKWPHPARRVLPVIVRPTEFERLPAYLRSVSVLYPEGDVVAETTAAVSALVSRWWLSRRILQWGGVALALCVAVGGLAYQNILSRQQGCVRARQTADDAGRRVLESIAGAQQESEEIRATRDRAMRELVGRGTWGPFGDPSFEKDQRCERRYVPQINDALRDLDEAIGRVEKQCSVDVTIDPTVRAELDQPFRYACGLHPSDYAITKDAIETAIRAVRAQDS